MLTIPTGDVLHLLLLVRMQKVLLRAGIPQSVVQALAWADRQLAVPQRTHVHSASGNGCS